MLESNYLLVNYYRMPKFPKPETQPKEFIQKRNLEFLSNKPNGRIGVEIREGRLGSNEHTLNERGRARDQAAKRGVTE